MSETVQNIVENNDPAFPVVSEGYAPDEVQKFVNEAQNIVARLIQENAELRNELKAKNPYQAVAGESVGLLVHAQQVSEEFIAKAQEQSNATIAEANTYREETVTEANDHRNAVISEANADAERIVGDAEKHVSQLKEEITVLTETRDDLVHRALAFHKQETERLNEYLSENTTGE